MSATQAPRVALGQWPTPLEPLPRLSALLGGPRLWVKRDDVGPLALGGNKVRKLEFLLGHALSLGATAILTTGAADSNHARITALACRRLGLRPLLLLRGEQGAPPQGNLLLDRLLGAEVRWQDPDSVQPPSELLASWAAELQATGEVPYVIPTGGSVGRGALGYVAAAVELARQAAEVGCRPAAGLSAAASGGTLAALLFGCARAGLPTGVVGVLVGDDEPSAFRRQVGRIAAEAAALLGAAADLPAPTLLEGFVGPGYGRLSADGRAAIELAARTEGLLLDPVYTGKAMAGLIAAVRSRRWRSDQDLVFLHTGGQAALFTHAAAWAEAR